MDGKIIAEVIGPDLFFGGLATIQKHKKDRNCQGKKIFL